MDDLRRDFGSGILDRQVPPCISVYLPTHRRHPQNRQDPIRFRNLVKEVEASLGRRGSPAEIESLLAPFHALAESSFFWNGTQDGLAALGAARFFRVYRLQRTVPERAIVADTFHVKPLLRILQSADRYHVLGLSRGAVRMFKGDRDALDEFEPAPEVPRTLDDALGEERTEPHRAVVSTGPPGSGRVNRGGGGTKKDEVEKDTFRYFRAVDRAVLEHHSRPEGIPLLLAALPEHHDAFRQVSHNPYLLPEAIAADPGALSIDTLRERAWIALEPRFRSRVRAIAESFEKARAQGRGVDDLEVVARAALAGRVASLLVEADRAIPGRIDAALGRIETADLAHPEVDDLLDDLAELVMKRNGRVVVVPADRMPTNTGAAAELRF